MEKGGENQVNQHTDGGSVQPFQNATRGREKQHRFADNAEYPQKVF